MDANPRPALPGADSPRRPRAALHARLLLLCALLPAGACHGAEQCPPDHIDDQARVGFVFDGDTVRLSDGRRLRLLGINTPEVGHKQGEHSEPLAERARSALRALVAGSPWVGLRYDAQRTDRYGRTLAHLFLPDGTNIQRSLLDQGLATTLVVPPNLWSWKCYRAAEGKARRAQRGLWRLSRYQAVEAADLPARAHGYRIVSGLVQRVGESRHALWLNLKGRLAVRIDKADLPWFKELSLRRLRGHRVLVRGWLHPGRDELRLNVRHPSALRRLD